MTESAITALMHLKMIVLIAKGDYSPRAGELEKREAAVAAFILTGQCIAGDEDRALIAKTEETVNGYFAALNAQNAA